MKAKQKKSASRSAKVAPKFKAVRSGKGGGHGPVSMLPAHLDAKGKPKAADWGAAAGKLRGGSQPTRPIGKIKLGKRHRKDYGDIAALARDINERGLLQPVVIDGADNLIAGERRIKAWQLSIFRAQPIPVHVVPLTDIVAGEYAENDPALRKNFTPSEAVAIKQAIERKLAPLAKARQAHGGTGGAGARRQDDRSRSGERAAAFTGKSRRTVEKAEAIVAAAKDDPEKFGKLQEDMDRTGRVDGPFKRLKVMQAAAEIRSAPSAAPANGPYGAGVIDIPWAAEPDNDDPARLERGFYPYPTMTPGQAADYLKEYLAPKLLPDCVVAIWAPNFHLANGHHLPVLEALGLRASTLLTGVKPGIGQGRVARGSTEQVVLGIRGKPVIEGFARTDFVMPVDRKHHSRKPQSFFDMFAKAVPASRYFSMFETVDRGDKWDGHGDQAPAKREFVDITEPAGELRLLEAIEAGQFSGKESPFDFNPNYHGIRHFFTGGGGKSKRKLTKAGVRQLVERRKERERLAAMDALPATIEEQIADYRATLARQQDAVLGADMAALLDCVQRLDLLQEKANGGTNFGMSTDESPAERLRRETAAPIGAPPVWGQRGMFQIEIDGVPYLVSHDEDFGIEAHAVRHDMPFVSDTGYQSLGFRGRPDPDWNEAEDLTRDPPDYAGMTVPAYVEKLIREEIGQEVDWKTGKSRPRKAPLPLPSAWFRLPTSWDEMNDFNNVEPVLVGKRKPEPEQTSAAKKQSGKKGDKAGPKKKNAAAAAPAQAAE